MILFQSHHHILTESTLGGSIYSYSLKKKKTYRPTVFSENHTFIQYKPAIVWQKMLDSTYNL